MVSGRKALGYSGRMGFLYCTLLTFQTFRTFPTFSTVDRKDHKLMKIISHGIDLVECSRIARMLDRHNRHFLQRLFTAHEQKDCMRSRNQIERLAGRFAVKEAVMKITGTGWRGGIAWTDIETVNDTAGKPSVRLTGVMAKTVKAMGIEEILVSITHTKELAIASAIAVG